MFTASLPPSVIASTTQSLKRVQEAPELRRRLMANSQRLYTGLKKAGFRLGPEVNPIVSVILPEREVAIAFWNELLAGGLYLNLALPPATPTGSPLLRSSVSAAHSNAQLDTAIELFREVGQKLGLPIAASSLQSRKAVGTPETVA
jgi:8-amino-7-oxononanoate synthase